MTEIRGILVEHDGSEYLVTADRRGLPDLLINDKRGSWQTLKRKGPKGKAGHVAQEMLAALGEPAVEDHTQQHIKRLVISSVNEIIRKFFQMARW
jgi:hypothetical protein